MKLGKAEETVPTVGFNVETIKYKNIIMNTWDVGGQERLRALWRHYFSGSDILIYVVDSSDLDRVEKAKSEFYKVIDDKELVGCHVVLLANKQDLPNALSPSEIINKFELRTLQNHEWTVIPTVATKGTGLTEVLSWIFNHMK